MSFDLMLLNGDLQIATNADVAVVRDTDKLVQDIKKIARTPLGGNPFFPWYGSPISKTLIGNPLGMTVLGTIASSQLRSSLTTLQKIQKIQAQSGQVVTPAEMLAAVQEVKIERNQVDPRFVRVVIKALTRAFTAATTSFNLPL